MGTISWYINRLKGMSVMEIIHRIKELIVSKVLEKKYTRSIMYIFDKNNFINSDESLYKVEANIKKCFKDVSSDEFHYDPKYKIYNTYIDLNMEIKWNICTISEWNNISYCKNYDYKNSEDIGEIRYTWEINRCQFFITLAMDYKCNKNNNSYILLKKHFYSWNKENPFLIGVNWSSPMEIAIRAYQWLITYSIIIDSCDMKFKKDLMNGIINSIIHVMKNLSLYSSANNHLIIESAISGIVGKIVEPLYKQEWLQKSYQILSKELKRQVFEDGVSKEQATHYHAFVLDMLLQYNTILKTFHMKVLDEELLYKMSEFLKYILFDESKKCIEIGDSDDAYIINFGKAKENYYRYILAFASAYFNGCFLENIDSYLELQLFNLEIKSKEKIKVDEVKLFKDGGYAIIRKNFKILFDFGELGFDKIKAHGHADALSVIIYYKNTPICIDAGTYIYNSDDKWRNYFRSTKMHNTLTISDKSQSEMAGPFLWKKASNSKLEEYSYENNIIKISASNDGYLPISLHNRTIIYYEEDDILVICDHIEKGEGKVSFLVDPSVCIEAKNKKVIKINGIFITSNVEYTFEEIYVSDSFLEKKETKNIIYENNFNDKEYIYTAFSMSEIKLLDKKILTDKGKELLIN